MFSIAALEIVRNFLCQYLEKKIWKSEWQKQILLGVFDSLCLRTLNSIISAKMQMSANVL